MHVTDARTSMILKSSAKCFDDARLYQDDALADTHTRKGRSEPRSPPRASCTSMTTSLMCCRERMAPSRMSSCGGGVGGSLSYGHIRARVIGMKVFKLVSVGTNLYMDVDDTHKAIAADWSGSSL